MSLSFLNELVVKKNLRMALGVMCGLLLIDFLLKMTFKTIGSMLNYIHFKQDFVFHLYVFFHGWYAIGFVVTNEAFAILG